MRKLIIVFLLLAVLIAYALSGAIHIAGAPLAARATWTPRPATHTPAPVTPVIYPTDPPAYPAPGHRSEDKPTPVRSGLRCRSC